MTRPKAKTAMMTTIPYLTEAVWGASPIPAAQPVALFARLAQEFSCADYGILISVGFL